MESWRQWGSGIALAQPVQFCSQNARPKGKRPLRIALHPVARPQEAVNKVSAKMQIAVLGDSPLGPIVKGVLD